MKYKHKDYNNSSFYKTKAWRKVSKTYMTSKYYVCERCGQPATICHHKTWLNGSNINDPSIALDFNNLEALCIECHNAEHSLDNNVTIFTSDGDIEEVKETQDTIKFKRQQEQINSLLSKLDKQSNN